MPCTKRHRKRRKIRNKNRKTKRKQNGGVKFTKGDMVKLKALFKYTLEGYGLYFGKIVPFIHGDMEISIYKITLGTKEGSCLPLCAGYRMLSELSVESDTINIDKLNYN